MSYKMWGKQTGARKGKETHSFRHLEPVCKGEVIGWSENVWKILK